MNLIDNDLMGIGKSPTSTSNDEFLLTRSPRESENFEIATGQTANETIDPSTTTYDIFDVNPGVDEQLRKIEYKGQLIQYNSLVDSIKEVVIGDDPYLPKIKVSVARDNAIKLSWRVDSAHFIVSIYEDQKESCWALLLGRGDPRGYASDGYLNDPEFKIHLSIIFELLKKYHNKGH